MHSCVLVEILKRLSNLIVGWGVECMALRVYNKSHAKRTLLVLQNLMVQHVSNKLFLQLREVITFRKNDR